MLNKIFYTLLKKNGQNNMLYIYNRSHHYILAVAQLNRIMINEKNNEYFMNHCNGLTTNNFMNNEHNKMNHLVNKNHK